MDYKIEKAIYYGIDTFKGTTDAAAAPETFYSTTQPPSHSLQPTASVLPWYSASGAGTTPAVVGEQVVVILQV